VGAKALLDYNMNIKSQPLLWVPFKQLKIFLNNVFKKSHAITSTLQRLLFEHFS